MNQDPRKILLPASYPRRTVDELLDAMLHYVDKTFRTMENAKNPSVSHLAELGKLVTSAVQLKNALSKTPEIDPDGMTEEQLRKLAENGSK